ncbi:unnamed protein product, partial [Laminaria digitata]
MVVVGVGVVAVVAVVEVRLAWSRRTGGWRRRTISLAGSCRRLTWTSSRRSRTSSTSTARPRENYGSTSEETTPLISLLPPSPPPPTKVHTAHIGGGIGGGNDGGGGCTLVSLQFCGCGRHCCCG